MNKIMIKLFKNQLIIGQNEQKKGRFSAVAEDSNTTIPFSEFAS